MPFSWKIPICQKKRITNGLWAKDPEADRGTRAYCDTDSWGDTLVCQDNLLTVVTSGTEGFERDSWIGKRRNDVLPLICTALWIGDNPLESMEITWHKTILSASRTRAREHQRAEFYCLSLSSPWECWQYIRLALLFQCTNVISPLWHCPAAPIPIISSSSVPRGSGSGMREDANAAPRAFCQLLPLSLPLGMVLQPANCLCWAGLQQNNNLTLFFPSFPPCWQKSSVIPRWKAPKDSFLLSLKKPPSL